MKNIGIFLSENFQFLVVKFSIYFNRRVFVMEWNLAHVLIEPRLIKVFKTLILYLPFFNFGNGTLDHNSYKAMPIIDATAKMYYVTATVGFVSW